MSCWTLDIHGELSSAAALAVPEPRVPNQTQARSDIRVERGGAWSFTREWRRAASRYRDSAITRDTGREVRLVQVLSR